MDNHIILDTETTGLDSDAQIVEISIINNLGEVLLDTLVKPTLPIPAQAISIHGITDDMVANAPSYDQIHPQVIALLEKSRCHIYNASYDVRLIRQTCQLYGIPFDSSLYSFSCVMNEYSDIHNDGFWAKLTKAYSHARMSNGSKHIGMNAHRALADCYMTREVIHFLEATPEPSIPN